MLWLISRIPTVALEAYLRPALRCRPGEFQIIAKIFDRLFVNRKPGCERVIGDTWNLPFHVRLYVGGVNALVLDPPDLVLKIEEPKLFDFDAIELTDARL